MARTADRDANSALRERFEEMSGQFARMRAGIADLQDQMTKMQVTVASADKMVTVTVGPRGQLVKLVLDPRACRQFEPQRLADLITETVALAAAKAGEEVAELMAGVLPQGSAMPNFLRTNDFGPLLDRYQSRLAEREEGRDGRR